MAVRVTGLTVAGLPRRRRLWAAHWGGDTMVTGGRLRRLAELPGVEAWVDDDWAGVLTWATDAAPAEWEIVSLDARAHGRGVGSALLRAVAAAARQEGVGRLWLVTSNDNVEAVGWYQRRGFRLVRVHLDAITRARVLKPEIPQVGHGGIPIRDEWELEWRPAPDGE